MATLLQCWPFKIMYHCRDAAGVVVVASDIASWVTLNLLQFIDVSASVRIPHCGSILNHRSDVRFVGWVSDETAGSEITVQESSIAFSATESMWLLTSLEQLHWLPVHQHIDDKLAVLTYKICSTSAPSTSAAISELAKLCMISFLSPCCYCTNRQPGIILLTVPSAVPDLLSGIFWTVTLHIVLHWLCLNLGQRLSCSARHLLLVSSRDCYCPPVPLKSPSHWHYINQIIIPTCWEPRWRYIVYCLFVVRC